ncbi:hypothetical protein V8E54_001990 [Elaphomyces granulatus]
MANSIPSSSPYKEGNKFTLHVDTAFPLFSEKSGATIEVEVQKVFEPVTMSPVMVVRLNGERKNLVLKLYDRRFCPRLRTSEHMDAWDEQREKEYVDFVLSGAAHKYVEYMNDDGASDETDMFDSMTDVQGETYLYERCNDLYTAETLAYRALNGLQGQSIPILFATVSLRIQSTTNPEYQKYFDIPGILLEHIDGFRLTHLAENVPQPYWQSICDDAVSTVNAASACGILNKDVNPDNFVVRKIAGRTETVYKPILLDFALSRTQGAEESNEDWTEAREAQDEEGAIGCVMQLELSRIGGGYTFHHSFWYDSH